MRALLVALSSCGLAVAATTVATGQDYTHPRQMDLPATSFRRPDPAALQHRLSNGLVAYVVEDHTVPLITLTVFVRAGRADAPPGVAGALERGLRSGPADLGPRDVAAVLADMTADFQVSVGPELTQITLNVPAEDGWRALEFLAGVLRAPSLTQPAAGARPAGATPSERAGAESGPVMYEGSMPAAVELFERLLYGDHRYGPDGPVSPALAEVTDFHRRWFVPPNVVLGVAGDFNAAEARQRLEHALGAWRAAGTPRRASTAPLSPFPGTPGPRAVHLYDVDKLQGWVVMGHDLPVVPLPDEAPLAVMNYILAGDHLAGRMFLEARDRRGLANDEIGHPEARLRGPGTYTIRAAGRPESITQLIDVALREVAGIQGEPVTAEELFVAQGALADGEFAYHFRNGHATAAFFAREWSSHGDHRRSATYAERIRAVTASDVRAAARKYLAAERMQVVVLGPIARIREAARRGGHPAVDSFGPVVESR
ncbi:MAG TPA: pitrilysin family protein [Gemmatimonadales bacterium]|nr:pitrilysin family protein [Gemmatimonadales bacterium]